jgi:uncharacterized protein (DUF2062 family)
LVGNGFFRKKLVAPVVDLMRQGITPERIAISISLGIALGVFPVLGATTLLCALAAVTLGLNLPAIQLVNYLVYPLQLALLIPFMHLGGWLFRSGPEGFSLSEVVSLIRTDIRHAIVTLWSSTVHAIGAWLLILPPLVLILNPILVRLLRRLSVSMSHRQRPAGEIS